MKIKFKRNFKVVDNGDLTQNLHSLSYQNNILISEVDLGNVEDILFKLKKQQEIIDKTKKFLKDEGQKQYNIHDNYRGKWYSPDELDMLNKILEDKEV